MVIIEETGGAAHLTADGLHHAGSAPPSATPPEFRMSNDHRIDRSTAAYNTGGRAAGTSGLAGSLHQVVYQEDELFCLSVAQTLKRLPAPRRSLAKVQMLQLIHDIEFGHS